MESTVLFESVQELFYRHGLQPLTFVGEAICLFVFLLLVIQTIRKKSYGEAMFIWLIAKFFLSNIRIIFDILENYMGLELIPGQTFIPEVIADSEGAFDYSEEEDTSNVFIATENPSVYFVILANYCSSGTAIVWAFLFTGKKRQKLVEFLITNFTTWIGCAFRILLYLLQLNNRYLPTYVLWCDFGILTIIFTCNMVVAVSCIVTVLRVPKSSYSDNNLKVYRKMSISLVLQLIQTSADVFIYFPFHQLDLALWMSFAGFHQFTTFLKTNIVFLLLLQRFLWIINSLALVWFLKKHLLVWKIPKPPTVASATDSPQSTAQIAT